MALAQKLIVRSGAWFRYGETQLGQGREKTRRPTRLKNPALVEELKNKITAAGARGCLWPSEPGDDAEDSAADSEE